MFKLNIDKEIPSFNKKNIRKASSVEETPKTIYYRPKIAQPSNIVTDDYVTEIPILCSFSSLKLFGHFFQTDSELWIQSGNSTQVALL